MPTYNSANFDSCRIEESAMLDCRVHGTCTKVGFEFVVLKRKLQNLESEINYDTSRLPPLFST